MIRNNFKRISYKQYSDILWKSDFLAWGNAKEKRKSLRRYSRRKLKQILT